jgi:hypothetical protein
MYDYIRQLILDNKVEEALIEINEYDSLVDPAVMLLTATNAYHKGIMSIKNWLLGGKRIEAMDLLLVKRRLPIFTIM